MKKEYKNDKDKDKFYKEYKPIKNQSKLKKDYGNERKRD